MIQAIEKFCWRLLDSVDAQLDKLTSYRLVLYSLIADISVGLGLAFGGRLPFKWYELLASALWLVIVCWLINRALARWLNIPTNRESDLITALILSLIMTPAANLHGYLVLAMAGGAAIASKFLITVGHRHIFNPAAFGAVVTGLALSGYASWWIGTAGMLPIIVVTGSLILRKMKRYTMPIIFLAAVLVTMIISGQPEASDNFRYIIIHSQILFFVDIMLIEPLTTPTKLRNYSLTAVIVAVCYTFNKLHLSPEESLLVGNAAGFLLEPNLRTKLNFVGSRREAADIYSFLFRPAKPFKFSSGQYVELTLPQSASDSRGNRRYITISSSPTEETVNFSVKIPAKPSAFKAHLAKFKEGDYLLASRLAGSFTLPKNNRKLVFIAGGVGITPFRSIAKQLIDSRQDRSIDLIYLAKTADEFAFKDLFDAAESAGIKTSYLATDESGRLTPEKLKKQVPDFKDCLFYISGPYGMVSAIRDAILALGVSSRQIKLDYFPGYG